MVDSIAIIAFAVYFLAGTIKGTLGIGLPTTGIALMSLVVDARSAIALAVIPMLATNAWQVYRSGAVVEVAHNYWRLGLSMILTIAVFSLLSVEVPIKLLTMVLGIAVLLFAVISLWKQPPPLPDRFDAVAQISVGLASGAMGGIAGVWAPAIVIYLSSRRQTKDEFVQTIGLLLFLGSLVLLLGYWKVGIMSVEITQLSTLLVVPAIAGFAFGERLRDLVSRELFQKLIMILFMLVGANLIRRSYGI